MAEKSGVSIKVSSEAHKKLRRLKKKTGRWMIHLFDEAIEDLCKKKE